MTLRGWVLGAFVLACAHRPPNTAAQAPVSSPAASLVVRLEPSAEVPTGVRAEIANPSSGPLAFCLLQSPFEGAVDDIFEVRAADGTELLHHGPPLEHPTCTEADWVIVQPGRFHIAEVDLATGYPLREGQVYVLRYRGGTASTLPASAWLDLVVE